MQSSELFFRAVLDSLTEQLAVIDTNGDIIFVNESWTHFGTRNQANENSWLHKNYITICKKAADAGDIDAIVVVDGLQKLLSNELSAFNHEYPCHSPTEQRWFMMRAVPLHLSGKPLIVITHQDITARKLAEQKAEQLSVQDSLTGLANRRKFNQHSKQLWKELVRNNEPVSLAFIDIDHFKRVNDNFGHTAGDKVLAKMASVLTKAARRPSDICARYGGEEFVLLLGKTRLDDAQNVLAILQEQIREEDFFPWLPDEQYPVTISIGLVSATPHPDDDILLFIEAADKLLYQAKKTGRDRMVCADIVIHNKSVEYS